MIEDHQAVVNDLTRAGQELIDTYTPDNGQIVHDEVTLVLSKYSDVKRDIREQVHLLNDALRLTITDVSIYTLFRKSVVSNFGNNCDKS